MIPKMFRYQHTEAMLEADSFGDALLGSMCPNNTKDNWRLFEVDLHCAYVYIIAEVEALFPLKYNVVYLNIYAESSEEARNKCIEAWEGLGDASN